MFVSKSKNSNIISAFVYIIATVNAFSPTARESYSTRLGVVDPILVGAAAAAVGTATGWVSRSGEVTDLQQKNVEQSERLLSLKNALNSTKVDFELKKESYEGALYEMDTDFEGETAKIKAEFDKKLEITKEELKQEYKEKLVRVKDTIEKESELKLVEQEGRLKQKFLQEKASYEAEFNARTASDLVQALETQSKLVKENRELKESLDQVQADLKEIMEAKNRLFG